MGIAVISPHEIAEFSREFGLEQNIVEKDYVLGWVLAAIFAQPALKSAWAFKGGTCLKKCYFETYRFSEDLDFTLRDPAQIDELFLNSAFAQVAEAVYDKSGIEVPKDSIKIRILSRKSRVSFVSGEEPSNAQNS